MRVDVGLQHRHVVKDLARCQNPVGDRGDAAGHDIELDVSLRLGGAGRFRNGGRCIGEAGFLHILHRIAVGATRGQQVADRQAALARGDNPRLTIGYDEVAGRAIGIGREGRDDRLDLDTGAAAGGLAVQERLDGVGRNDAFTDRPIIGAFVILLLAGELLFDLVKAGLGFIERGQRLVGQLLGCGRELFTLGSLAQRLFGDGFYLVMARIERSLHFLRQLIGALGLGHGIAP